MLGPVGVIIITSDSTAGNFWLIQCFMDIFWEYAFLIYTFTVVASSKGVIKENKSLYQKVTENEMATSPSPDAALFFTCAKNKTFSLSPPVLRLQSVAPLHCVKIACCAFSTRQTL